MSDPATTTALVRVYVPGRIVSRPLRIDPARQLIDHWHARGARGASYRSISFDGPGACGWTPETLREHGPQLPSKFSLGQMAGLIPADHPQFWTYAALLKRYRQECAFKRTGTYNA